MEIRETCTQPTNETDIILKVESSQDFAYFDVVTPDGTDVFPVVYRKDREESEAVKIKDTSWHALNTLTGAGTSYDKIQERMKMSNFRVRTTEALVSPGTLFRCLCGKWVPSVHLFNYIGTNVSFVVGDDCCDSLLDTDGHKSVCMWDSMLQQLPAQRVSRDKENNIIDLPRKKHQVK